MAGAIAARARRVNLPAAAGPSVISCRSGETRSCGRGDELARRSLQNVGCRIDHLGGCAPPHDRDRATRLVRRLWERNLLVVPGRAAAWHGAPDTGNRVGHHAVPEVAEMIRRSAQMVGLHGTAIS